MATLFVTDRSGATTEIEIRPNITLMQTITDAGINDLLALCGGVCSCATCHVHIDSDSAGKLTSISEDEDCLLDGSNHRQQHSRLSCQIRMSPELDGLRVTIAEEE